MWRSQGVEDEYFYMYKGFITYLGVIIHFTTFETYVLKEINDTLLKLNPNIWDFMRGFEILCWVLRSRLVQVFSFCST